MIVLSLHINRTLTKTNKTDGRFGFRYSLIENLNYVTRSHVLALHTLGYLWQHKLTVTSSDWRDLKVQQSGALNLE